MASWVVQKYRESGREDRIRIMQGLERELLGKARAIQEVMDARDLTPSSKRRDVRNLIGSMGGTMSDIDAIAEWEEEWPVSST